MKRLLLLLLLIPSLCFATDLNKLNGNTLGATTGNTTKVDGVTWGTSTGNYTKWNGFAATAGTSYLFSEGFEGDKACGGENNCENENWTNTDNAEENFHATGLVGDHALTLTDSASSYTEATSPVFTAQSGMVYAFFKVKFTSLPTTGDINLAYLTSSTAAICYAYLSQTTGNAYFRVKNGTVSGARCGTILNTTSTYSVWLSCSKGASDGKAYLAFAADSETKPADCSTTESGNGNSGDITKIGFLGNSSTTIPTIDKIRVSTTAIGNDPL